LRPPRAEPEALRCRSHVPVGASREATVPRFGPSVRETHGWSRSGHREVNIRKEITSKFVKGIFFLYMDMVNR
ncbi:hypothetical protein, partial [Streptomyces sp. NPDC002769]|uniref:hypothetical protein n=1 Tax=Streptomyces sp. NPDC002769 TaxID=3154542 RepID=UPI003328383E